MMIVYGYKREFKREAALGSSTCPNCGHTAAKSLCRQIDKAHIFFIPIFHRTAQQGLMCESCGIIQPMDKAQYTTVRRQYTGQ